jgi:methyl-accepting chemotaxis protein
MQDFFLRFVPDSLRTDADVFRRARLMVAISFISVLTASFYAVQYAVSLQLPVPALCLGFVVVVLVIAPFVLQKTASLRLTGNLVVGCYFFTQIVLIYFEGGPISQARYWSSLIPILATLFNGMRSGLLWALTTVVMLVSFTAVKQMGFVFPPGLSAEQLKTQSLIGLTGLTIVAYLLARVFEAGKEATFAMLESARRESEQRAQENYHKLEDIKAANERQAATDLQRIQTQKEYLTSSVEDIVTEVHKVAQGDLTVVVQVGLNDDIARLSEGLTHSIENVRQMLARVTEAVHTTTNAVSSISGATEQIAASSQQQSSQVGQVASAVEEMSRTIAENTEQTTIAAFEASEANTDALRGGDVMRSMIENVLSVGKVVLESSETVMKLGQSSEQIGQIVAVIDEIAEQTNLLALNAAIEAARAGDQGRGFAVVADEVRKLAERTQTATREISSMIGMIQTEMQDAVDGMNTGRDLVAEGSSLIEQTTEALNNIVSRTSKVSDVVSQVAAASEEQAATSDEMARNMTRMSQMVDDSTKGLTEIARSLEGLLRQAEHLQGLLGKFNIGQLPVSPQTKALGA